MGDLLSTVLHQCEFSTYSFKKLVFPVSGEHNTKHIFPLFCVWNLMLLVIEQRYNYHDYIWYNYFWDLWFCPHFIKKGAMVNFYGKYCLPVITWNIKYSSKQVLLTYWRIYFFCNCYFWKVCTLVLSRLTYFGLYETFLNFWWR